MSIHINSQENILKCNYKNSKYQKINNYKIYNSLHDEKIYKKI